MIPMTRWSRELARQSRLRGTAAAGGGRPPFHRPHGAVRRMGCAPFIAASPGPLEKYHKASDSAPTVFVQRQRLTLLSRFGLPKPWHHPNFMSTASPLEKEAWLKSLLGKPHHGADTEAYLIVLRALSVSELPDAALRAERWMVRLEKAGAAASSSGDDSHDPRLVPTAECYQRVVEAWAAATRECPSMAVTRAERWLFKNQDSSDPSARPGTACFNAFLDLCSKGRALKQGGEGRQLVRQHAQKAETILLHMIEDRKNHGAEAVIAPDTDSFNYLIRAFTRIRFDPSMADKAVELLRLFEDYQRTVDSSVRPNIKSYAMVMDAIAMRARHVVKQNLRHKHLWKDPAHNGLHEIHLLNQIIEYMRNSGRRALEPNAHAYNVLCSAWANLSSRMHPDAPLEAEKIVQRMIRLRDQGVTVASPDAYSYQMIMRAWKNSPKMSRGKRVAWWLDQQWKDYEFEGNEALQPTTGSYNLAMQVWAGLGEPIEAERMLQELLRLGEDDRSFLRPNAESYAAVIKAWLVVAERGSFMALKNAAKWIKIVCEQEKMNTSRAVTSSVDWFSSILSATRKCAPQYPEAMDLALELFGELSRSHHSVDCLHYSRLIQTGLLAWSHEEDNLRRSRFLREYLTQCQADGLVSRPLLRALANGPVFYDGWTIEESRRCLEEFFPVWPLPPEWTRNIRQDGFRPRHIDMKRLHFTISHHGRIAVSYDRNSSAQANE